MWYLFPVLPTLDILVFHSKWKVLISILWHENLCLLNRFRALKHYLFSMFLESVKCRRFSYHRYSSNFFASVVKATFALLLIAFRWLYIKFFHSHVPGVWGTNKKIINFSWNVLPSIYSHLMYLKCVLIVLWSQFFSDQFLALR